LAGQVKKIAGDLSVNGKVAYVSQQAWLTNDTVKNNILFGLPYDEKRYMRTIAACQLTSDLAQLPAEDETEVGERGINLRFVGKPKMKLTQPSGLLTCCHRRD
jgi:ABC-type bacteriocin/lantibiotic exporter with double-glycine peptidase domain